MTSRAMTAETPKRAIWTAAGVTGAAVLAFLLVHIVRVVQVIGDWCYTLDDAYIHLAIASTLRHHGVWGLTRFYPAGASSSPLWTLLHAGLGAGELVPLILNVVLVVGGAAWLAATCAVRSGSAAIGIAFGIGAALFVSALAAATTGMEHLFHSSLCVLLLIGCLAAAGDRTAKPFLARSWMLGLLAALGVLCRAETLLVLSVALTLLLVRRRFGAAASVAFGGVAGLGLYSVIGWWQGIPVIPNSVAIKALETNGSGLFGRFLVTVTDQGRYAVLSAIVVAAFVFTLAKCLLDRRTTPTRLAVLVATAILPIHLFVGKITHVGRYEVYALTILAALTFPEIAARLRRGDPLRAKIAVAFLVPVVTVTLLRPRLVGNMVLASEPPFRWSRQIDASPREMARFVNQEFPGTAVLLNDVGAVSLLTRSRVIDLWGLGNNEVCRERLRVGGVPTPAWIGAFARREQGELAMVFDPWFVGRTHTGFRYPGEGLPPSWTKVGEFRVNVENEILGGPVISIYAVRPQDAARFRAALTRYRARSPLNTVVVL